jgi:3-deoxy-D-manno-octulosonic-acid transferase
MLKLKSYNRFVLPVARVAAEIAALTSAKLARGIDGRSGLIAEIRAHYAGIDPLRKRVLVHVASFGELEQAKPVIEALKRDFPDIHLHLTFFSPSGLENAKGKYQSADLITYSSFDYLGDVKAFVSTVRPNLALFARYDLWPNMSHELRKMNVPTILFSATFDPKRKNGVMKKLHVETYDQLSLLLTIALEDVEGFRELGVTVPRIEIAGDTRFDQVANRRHAAEAAGQIVLPRQVFEYRDRSKTFVVVAGSTWPEDEKLLEQYFKQATLTEQPLVYIIAPHEPTPGHVQMLMNSYGKEAILLSDCEHYAGQRAIIVDSVGKLFDLYKEADAVLVGGGFSTGIHNVLEPATWGKPVLFGPNNSRSREVRALAVCGGGFEVKSAREFAVVLDKLRNDKQALAEASMYAKEFVEKGRGATERIVDYIRPFLS